MDLPKYTIEIHDSYSSWEIKDEYNNKIELNINPYHEKLVNGDNFHYNHNQSKIIVSHSILKNDVIPGILIIESNKTYGRNAKGKLLYKFIPNNNTFPHFLVQYELKNVGLTKAMPNLYVMVQFTGWADKHPNGIISQLIGNVDTPDHFYEYQLYSKQLYSPIQKLNKEILNIIHTPANNFNYDESLKLIAQKYNIINYRLHKKYYIFTIDNLHTIHYDDAISIMKDNLASNPNTFIISIYISNASLWLDYYNLWEHLTDSFKRVANIYLPHKKINMFPPIFIDTFLNLKENTHRLAIAFDITIREGHIINIQPNICIIHINKNYVYNDSPLLNNKHYKLLNAVVKTMDNLENINAYDCDNMESRKIIEYLMVVVNNYCAKQLFTPSTPTSSNGIFKIYNPNTNTHILNNIENPFISKINKKMNSQLVDSSYCFLNGITQPYLNITSPMRKITDVINLCIFQKLFMLVSLSETFQTFYSFWINNLNYINSYVKHSKKIQNKCQLLHSCIQRPEDIYNGVIIDICPNIENKKCGKNENKINKYVVYLEKINLISKLISKHNYDIGYVGTFKIYVFINELNMKKKIRILQS